MKKWGRIVAVLLVVSGAGLLYSRRQDALLPRPVQPGKPSRSIKAEPDIPSGRRQRALSPTGVRHHSTEGTAQTPTTVPPPQDSEEPARVAQEKPIPGELILGFYNDDDLQAFLKLARENGVRILGALSLGHSVRIAFDSADALDRILATGPTPISRSPNFYVYQPPPVQGSDPRAPDGPYYGFGGSVAQWLGLIGDRSEWGKGITVAVLDSGVQSHAVLDGAQIATINMSAEGGTGVEDLHGTSVASLIAGNGQGVQGLAPSAQLLSIDVMSGEGVGDLFTLAAAIVEAVDRGSRVINVSLGSYGQNAVLAQAVDYAVTQGAVVVAAAGNDAVSGVLYPAAYDDVIAVGAVDSVAQHLYFSNRGDSIDIVAPGLAINAAGEENGVGAFSGTSAATPLVSAAIAGLLSTDSTLSAAEAAAIVLAYADDYGAPGRDAEYGEGILDLARVESRNTPGIYDAAVGRPYIADSGESQDLVVYVENRGTEPLGQVNVQMSIGGVPASVAFYNVGVGETASRTYALDAQVLQQYGEIEVSLTASIADTQDVLPGNDSVSGVVRLGPGE